MTLKDIIRQAIVDALEKTGGNQKAAARLLAVSVRVLNYQMKALGIPRPIDTRVRQNIGGVEQG